MIHEMQQILMDDVPYIIPYYWPVPVRVAQRHVHRLAADESDARDRGSLQPERHPTPPSRARAGRASTRRSVGRARVTME